MCITMFVHNKSNNIYTHTDVITILTDTDRRYCGNPDGFVIQMICVDTRCARRLRSMDAYFRDRPMITIPPFITIIELFPADIIIVVIQTLSTALRSKTFRTLLKTCVTPTLRRALPCYTLSPRIRNSCLICG